MTFVISQGGVDALMVAPGVGFALTHFANEVVVPTAMEYCGQKWPGGKSPGGTPPRPFWRSGQLIAKMRPAPARVEGKTQVVWCITDPDNKGHLYAKTLLEGRDNMGQYHFMPPEFYVGDTA
jgi:hypothetical protein